MRIGPLFLIAISMLITIGQATETAAVNRFYGVVLKMPEVRSKLEKHQADRKEAFTVLGAKYQSDIQEEYDKFADSGNLEMAKIFRAELDRVGDFNSSVEDDSTDCVSDSLLSPDLAGLSARPPSQLVGFRQTWQKDRRQLLVGSQEGLYEDLGKFVGQLTKERKFEDAQAVSDFQQLVASRLKTSETVLAAIAARENPKTRSNHANEDGHIVIYPADAYAYRYGVLIDPTDGYWLDGIDARDTLYLKFPASQFGPFRNQISKALLTLHVPDYGAADSNHYIRVYIEGKQVGIRKGGRKGERLQIPIELTELKGEKEIILQLTINGSDGMGIVGSGADRPRLLLAFQ